MILSPSTVLEREIGKYLKAWQPLIDMLGDPVPIISTPGEDQALPYLVYNENRLLQNDSDTTAGGEHEILIEFWSGTESEALVKDVMHQVKSALYYGNRTKAIDISPYKLVLIHFVVQDLVRETDGQAIRCTAQFRALTGGHEI